MTATTKITKRDRYTSIIDILKDVNADADLVTFCEGEIALLDKKSAKAKETAAAKKTEVDTLTESIKDALGTLADGAYATIADVTAMVGVGDEEVTPNKVSYRLSQLVKAGVAESTDVKVPATETSKARTIKAYRVCM
jgi:hypothetical protein